MANGKYKVTVVMLTYNQAGYIDEAIKSVMHQNTNFDFELLISDDYSTDDTLEHCRKWQQQYGNDRIVILTAAHNSGIQANYLRAFDACRGEYIAICEGDDYWIDRNKLQMQVDFLDSHRDYAICVHRVVNYYENDGSKSMSNGGQKAENDILDLAQSNFISNVSAMWRRGLFGDTLRQILDPKKDSVTVDYAIHMLNAQYGKIHYINRCMAVYRKHNSAVWSQVGADKQYLMAMNVRRALMAHFKDLRPDVFTLLQEAYVNNAVALIRYYRANGSGENAETIIAMLKTYAPQLTDTEIQKKINAPAPQKSLRMRAFLVLKCLRRFVSRFVPVPRAK